MKIRPSYVAGLLVLLALPFLIRAAFPASEKYYLHMLVQIWLWSFIYTGCSLMGRFGLTSFGHGAFTGIGAYVTVLLWNFAGISPLIGIPVAIVAAMIAGILVGYPCFNLRIPGHYFALLTLHFTLHFSHDEAPGSPRPLHGAGQQFVEGARIRPPHLPAHRNRAI